MPTKSSAVAARNSSLLRTLLASPLARPSADSRLDRVREGGDALRSRPVLLDVALGAGVHPLERNARSLRRHKEDDRDRVPDLLNHRDERDGLDIGRIGRRGVNRSLPGERDRVTEGRCGKHLDPVPCRENGRDRRAPSGVGVVIENRGHTAPLAGLFSPRRYKGIETRSAASVTGLPAAGPAPAGRAGISRSRHGITSSGSPFLPGSLPGVRLRLPHTAFATGSIGIGRTD